MSKAEGVGSISTNDGAVSSGRGRERGADAIEAKVDPCSHEAKVGKEHGRLGAQDCAGDGIRKQEYGGEMLDAHANEALCNGYGMLGHELLKGNEEAGLDSDTAGDGGVPGLG